MKASVRRFKRIISEAHKPRGRRTGLADGSTMERIKAALVKGDGEATFIQDTIDWDYLDALVRQGLVRDDYTFNGKEVRAWLTPQGHDEFGTETSSWAKSGGAVSKWTAEPRRPWDHGRNESVSKANKRGINEAAAEVAVLETGMSKREAAEWLANWLDHELYFKHPEGAMRKALQIIADLSSVGLDAKSAVYGFVRDPYGKPHNDVLLAAGRSADDMSHVFEPYQRGDWVPVSSLLDEASAGLKEGYACNVCGQEHQPYWSDDDDAELEPQDNCYVKPMPLGWVYKGFKDVV